MSLVRAGLLLASVMVFNYGMGAVVQLYATATDQAVAVWQVIEPLAERWADPVARFSAEYGSCS